MRTSTFNLPDFRGAFLRGYGTGINRRTNVPSWCTSATIGEAQQPAIPTFSGTFPANAGGSLTGMFYQMSASSQGYGSSPRAYPIAGIDPFLSDNSYGRRERDVASFNYAVQFFIKY